MNFFSSAATKVTFAASLSQRLYHDVNVVLIVSPPDCCWVDIPLHFQADCVGRFTCQVVLSSCFDIRVYEMEAVVTSQVKDHTSRLVLRWWFFHLTVPVT